MRTTRIVALTVTLTVLALLAGHTLAQGPAAEKPRAGGVVTWFDYGDPGRLDPHTESPVSVQQATAGVYSGLLHYDPDDPTKIVGDLAEKWTVAPDGKTYTFHLRKGVKWHDGAPFSATDVKATFDRVLHPDFKSPKCGAMLKPMVAAVEVLDPFTVQFRLHAPIVPFVSSVASAWCRIAAKHVLDKYGDLNRPEAVIGTGPFKFKKYDRGSVVEWERNKDYFIPGLPYVDGVKQYILVGQPTQLAAAKAGRIMLWDAWPPMTRAQADEVKNARGEDVEIYRHPINAAYYVYMNAQKPPFNNVDLRRAVHLAIDRQELVAKGLDGAGVPCALLDPKLVGEYALPLEEAQKSPGCRSAQKEQDIAEAKKLVEKHHPGGLDIEVSVRQVGNYVDRAQLLLAQLRKVGIRGTLKTYESAAGYAVFGKGDFTLIASQDRGMDTTDPADVFSLIYTTPAGSNYSRWSDAKVDELADRALKETNKDRRKALYWELQRHIYTAAPGAVPIGWVEGYFFKDKKLRNFKPGSTIYDNNTFMKVWLAQ